MAQTAPREISGPVLDLCRELVVDAAPVWVKVTPALGAAVNDCFPTIEGHVREQGGKARYGWQMWEWPGVMVEGEFHAVWEDPSGALHDLTPKAVPTDRILFLPDPARRYEGRQVDNVRRAVSSDPAVQRLIETTAAEFEFINRGERADQHAISLSREAMEALAAIRQRRVEALADIYAGAGRSRRPRPNDPCFCGSGTKFKKCHSR
jgi:hypothetical protein